ncbi:MAG: DegV family protein [Tissierellales bacterium]|jgi:DegV family protein with EDD domain|nr:DegV family protein [Tissierellales bacterium]MBN2828099.1 DegV family protein [Tissierellales bacterium]
MAIRIVTDSTSDLPVSLAEQYNIKVAPLRVNFGETSYLDGVDLKTEDFYHQLTSSKELPTTSQVNPGEFEEIFKEILDQGDEIIGIFIAKELSGTYASAKIAKDTLKSDKVHLIDSRGVTAMISIMCVVASRMAEEGKSVSEIKEKVEHMAEHMKSAFLIDTLTYLVKGGRLSKAQGVAGSLLNVKPIIRVKDGVIDTIHKARGRAKGIKWLIDNIKEEGHDLSNKTVFIVNSNDPELGQKIKAALLAEFTVGEVLETQIGSVVGTHAGPGCGGITFCTLD